MRRRMGLRGVSIVVLLSSALVIGLGACSPNGEINQLIEDLAYREDNNVESEQQRADAAFDKLFTIGDPAIPELLKHAADLRESAYQIPPGQGGSVVVHMMGYKQSVRTVCLYLIEAIRTGVKFHSQFGLMHYPKQEWGNYDQYQKENQLRAKKAYEIWWNKLRATGEKDDPWEEIVPWIGRLANGEQRQEMRKEGIIVSQGPSKEKY